MQKTDYHRPVMVEEAMRFLMGNPDGVYVDANAGGGGHSAEILKRINSTGQLIALDLDPDAIAACKERFTEYPNISFYNLGSEQIDFVLDNEGISQIDGILYDLGVSSYQIDEVDKGFSFGKNSELDMRFNPMQKLTAETVINTYPVEQLIDIFKKYGEEKFSVRIAKAIDKQRATAVIHTSAELNAVILDVIPRLHANKTLARIYQAIRIEVNQELERLHQSLQAVFPRIKPGGTIVVLAYHSLEDRIVKTFFKEKARGCICPPEYPVCQCGHLPEVEILTRKVITASSSEKSQNPRARSAKLRAVRKR